MPTTALTVGNELLSTTAFSYLKEMRNLLDRPYPFVDDMMSMGKEDKEGGERVIIPTKTNRHSVNTRLSTGYEAWDDTANPIGTPGHDDWAYVVRPVLISGRDTILNRGPSKVLDILKPRVEDVEEALRANFNDAFWRGPAASGSWTGVPGFEDFNTANGDDETTGGFLEATAVGSQNSTVHNLSKTTYASLPHWQNQFYDAAGSASANLLIGVQDTLTRIEEVTGGGAKLKAYGSIDAINHYKRAVQPQERYTGGSADANIPQMQIGGVGATPTTRLPNNGAGTGAAGDNEWSLVFIDFSTMKFFGQSGWVFKMDEFVTIPKTGVRIAAMHIFGQFVCLRMSSQGLIIGADTW